LEALAITADGTITTIMVISMMTTTMIIIKIMLDA
jgi:hypothetical protein